MNPVQPLDKSAWDSCVTEVTVNAALSPHPKIVDLYSFCGLSMLSEAMPRGDLHRLAAPHYERCRTSLFADQWQLRNNLTGRQKVRLALEMAQAVQVLHTFPGGTIVHNDLQASQFLLSHDHKVKLTDFNRATVLEWSEKYPDRPCSYSYFKTPGSVSSVRQMASFLAKNFASLSVLFPSLVNNGNAVTRRIRCWRTSESKH